ncbi:hypothetical protein CDL12_26451 [Handroanthus impetiginosus]|uniref:NB-ARC domain-containing protein n=1 Tax=Handroanthus impetiginosus TaxID=429701 RepID=A0A2G9G760_9LAMI|nr:hypothetical protein CDL12_26451 [Handroanthus impetiginosus]
MVDAVVQSVSDKVGSVIFELGTCVVELPHNINLLQGRMKNLQSYLKDAESEAKNREACRLIIEIRDLAHDVEDIVDIYSAEIERDNARGLFGFLKQMSSALCHCMTSTEIANKIEEFNQRAESLEELKGDFKSESHDTASSFDELWRERRKFLLAPEPKKIFGCEDIFRELEKKMREGNTKICIMITIVGPGGVGKTTVARRIYKEMKDELNCSCAMVYVSHNPNTEEILCDITKQVGLSDNMMNEHLRLPC